MKYIDKWIWLSEEKYPGRQKTRFNAFRNNAGNHYTVAEFKKEYFFDKTVTSASIRFSADTEVQLFCNGGIVATGPATVEGDFLGNDKARNNHYAMVAEITPNKNKLDFFARVKLMPVNICEYSQGRGGFMLRATLTFSDGTSEVITTDESWLARYNGAYVAPYVFDGSIAPDEYSPAECIDDVWGVKTAPLKIRSEEEILPLGNKTISTKPAEEKEELIELDMIHAGFINLEVEAEGRVELEIICKETEVDPRASKESFVFDKNCEYRGLQIHSVGIFVIKMKNLSEHDASVKVSLIATYYPIERRARITTSDAELDRILDVCAHTLKYCRQLHHLDSPRHCEPLACTGDYYIESLMTATSYGDMSLAEFDVVRTAELLTGNDGRMFHTTYSLIWARMLLDVYMFTGNRSLLAYCEKALSMLLDRFERYVGDNGIVETPPDYMFIDWIYIDGLSMHHPPKALGQTCLNMFYFGALDSAAKIYGYLGDENKKRICEEKREFLKEAINSVLFDKEKGIYFEGLNSETPEEMLYTYMPKNVEKRYYLKHSNILAAYFGVCDRDTAKNLIEKVMSGEIEGDYQPYFAHYLLEAIYNNGLRDKYTLEVINKWKKPVSDCPKGLVEGFVAPEPGYLFDHSHAWGGTPLYSLPKAITGFEILTPGMTEIEFDPSLVGIDKAYVEILTPKGYVICELEKEKAPRITSPDGLRVIVKS